MFGKKKCSHCNKKVEKDFDYCPYCARSLKTSKKDYGLLGKDDHLNSVNPIPNNELGGLLGSSFMEKIMSSAVKMIEKEMQKSAIQENEIRKTKVPRKLPSNFELFINGQRVNLPGNIEGIQIENMPKELSDKKKTSKIPKVSEETLEKSVKLPRKEAKSHLTRTSDKVVYELETPGLLSLNNVLVNKLENSIEVKAYTEKAVYFKTLPVKLPLMQYSLKEDKLILEFKA